MEKQLRDVPEFQGKRKSVIKIFNEAINLVNMGSEYRVTEMQKADTFLRYLQKDDEFHFYVEFSNADKFVDVCRSDYKVGNMYGRRGNNLYMH